MALAARQAARLGLRHGQGINQCTFPFSLCTTQWKCQRLLAFWSYSHQRRLLNTDAEGEKKENKILVLSRAFLILLSFTPNPQALLTFVALPPVQILPCCPHPVWEGISALTSVYRRPAPRCIPRPGGHWLPYWVRK